MGAIAVEFDAGEGELAGATDGEDLSSNGGESCQLLGAEVALGLCPRQIQLAVSTSPAPKKVFALIAGQLAPSPIRTRAKILGSADR